ncbi:MAG: hypothetical protein LIO65_01560, partial [Odoribacter sp.]|nr:hypothetical protein [Odoribacter sp.]
SMVTMLNADSNIKKVELEMNKQEVIDIMGKNYEVLGAEKTPNGELIEKIGYKPNQLERYVLIFKNGKLTIWNKEQIYTPYTNEYYKDNTAMKAHLDAHRKAMLSTASTEAQKQHINFHMDAHEKAILGE